MGGATCPAPVSGARAFTISSAQAKWGVGAARPMAKQGQHSTSSARMRSHFNQIQPILRLAYALLEHAGDFTAAAKALAQISGACRLRRQRLATSNFSMGLPNSTSAPGCGHRAGVPLHGHGDRYQRHLYADPYLGAPAHRAKGIPVATHSTKEPSPYTPAPPTIELTGGVATLRFPEDAYILEFEGYRGTSLQPPRPGHRPPATRSCIAPGLIFSTSGTRSTLPPMPGRQRDDRRLAVATAIGHPDACSSSQQRRAPEPLRRGSCARTLSCDALGATLSHMGSCAKSCKPQTPFVANPSWQPGDGGQSAPTC